MVDKNVQVLFERKGRFDNQLVGKSEYLHAVNVTDPTISVGDLKQVHVTKSNANSLILMPHQENVDFFYSLAPQQIIGKELLVSHNSRRNNRSRTTRSNKYKISR